MSSAGSLRSSPALSLMPEHSEATTPATSPPATSPLPEASDRGDEEQTLDEDTENRLRMLSNLLEKSATYVTVLKQQMDKVKLGRARNSASKVTGAETSSARPLNDNAKRPHANADTHDSEARKRQRVQDHDTTPDAQSSKHEHAFLQPALITGATLKDYQLEGVAWMAGLYQSGISGILADEMGLGKTLQTIAFHAFLRERTTAPFLVVCPLSVLSNWVEEFRRFAPAIPVVMYHGTPEERAELRRTAMVFSEEDMKYQNKMAGQDGGFRAAPAAPRNKGKAARGKTGRGVARSAAKLSTRQKEASDDEEGSKAKTTKRAARSQQGSPSDKPDLPPHQRTDFPVVITTFEMIMKDRAPLSEYYWGFIVVDEGHRLKNMDCKLMREIKKLNAAARMVLTGTPLHNNLSELWALLNFVLPDLFGDLEAFEEWFDLRSLQSTLSATRSSQVISSLHAILRPFLLRRLKSDVEANLPPKKEYVIYAPLSERQREVYDAILKGGLRALLVKEARSGKAHKGGAPVVELSDSTDEEEEVPLRIQAKPSAGKKRESTRLKSKKRRAYDVDDGDDDVYFEKLESGELEAERQKEKEERAEQLGQDWQRKSTLRKVNNMKLQNTVMQLRKVCSHPFLFDWPADPKTHEPILNDDLVTASGKMLILDRLLEELFKSKHKVLLFSQFTTMLDIIQDWAVELKGWRICRIDGSTSMQQRRDEVDSFQNGGDDPDAPKLFLLSTRAGGLGLNLVAADTVIFYDQDWNPQMDLQAQDRAHRIGQTKPVLIFRLVSAHTVETKIMQRATEKRKLEAVVIAKGQFKTPSLAASRNRPETMAEMAAALLRLEGEQIQVVPNAGAGKVSVISDEDLDMLLDRRPEVFTVRGKGWTSAKVVGEPSEDSLSVQQTEKKAAFAVYETPANEAGDVLAGMLDEDDS